MLAGFHESYYLDPHRLYYLLYHFYFLYLKKCVCSLSGASGGAHINHDKELQRRLDAEEQELKAMQITQAMMRDMQRSLAEEWGVPWPKENIKDSRKGGPSCFCFACTCANCF